MWILASQQYDLSLEGGTHDLKLFDLPKPSSTQYSAVMVMLKIMVDMIIMVEVLLLPRLVRCP